jgi:hypothetical protein
MNKLVSICLIALMVFHSFGYYAVLMKIEYTHGKTQKKRLAADEYVGSDAIVIRIPAALPYSSNDDHYMQAEGKFIHNNQTFRLVKKRLMNDTLYLVCVKDKVDQKIREKMAEYANALSDSPQDGKKNITLPRYIKDYLPFLLESTEGTAGWEKEITFSSSSVYYSYIISSDIAKPPNRI